MPERKISVLSAVWNEAAHIAEMIDSVLGQEGVEVELLFVDDGSTDNTVEIIRSYAERDPRVVLVATHEHKGKVSAFNAAYAASTAPYICLLAGDDLLVPGSLNNRWEAVSKAPAGSKAVMWGKMLTFSTNPDDDGILLPRGDAVSRSGASGMMTRELADIIFPIPEVLPNEDTWVRVCAEELAEYSFEVPEVFVRYRLHDGNTSPRNLTFDEYVARNAVRGEVWRLLRDEPRLHFGYSAQKRINANWAIELAQRQKSLLGIAKVQDVTLLEKLAASWKANRLLYEIRTRNYRYFTGWLKA